MVDYSSYAFLISCFKKRPTVSVNFLTNFSLDIQIYYEKYPYPICMAFTPFSIANLLRSAGFSIFRIRNARLSEGDPYSAFAFLGDRLMNWTKNSFFIICDLLYYLSMRRILWSPSMEVFVYKLD